VKAEIWKVYESQPGSGKLYEISLTAGQALKPLNCLPELKPKNIDLINADLYGDSNLSFEMFKMVSTFADDAKQTHSNVDINGLTNISTGPEMSLAPDVSESTMTATVLHYAQQTTTGSKTDTNGDKEKTKLGLAFAGGVVGDIRQVKRIENKPLFDSTIKSTFFKTIGEGQSELQTGRTRVDDAKDDVPIATFNIVVNENETTLQSQQQLFQKKFKEGVCVGSETSQVGGCASQVLQETTVKRVLNADGGKVHKLGDAELERHEIRFEIRVGTFTANGQKQEDSEVLKPVEDNELRIKMSQE